MQLKEMNQLRTYLLNKSEKMTVSEIQELQNYLKLLADEKSGVQDVSQESAEESKEETQVEPEYETVSPEYTN